MNLLKAHRERKEALERRSNLPSVSHVLRDLRRDLGREADAYALRTSAAARRDAASSFDRHFQEGGGSYSKVDPKAGLEGVFHAALVGDHVANSSATASLRNRRAVRKKCAATATPACAEEDMATKNSITEGFVERLMGMLQAVSAQRAISAWSGFTRRERFERKRAGFQASLAFDDPQRARMIVETRRLLAEAQRLSWFSVDVKRSSRLPPSSEDARQAFPLSAPPNLRSDTCDDFGRLGETLRRLIHDMVQAQQERLAARERTAVERWMLKKQSKDVKRTQAEDQEATRQLELAKRQLAQAPTLLYLVQHMYLTTVIWSVENAAVFLSQVFSDTAFLQVRVMAVPCLHLAAPRVDAGGPSDDRRQPSTAVLVASPGHEQVQSHLNHLLESVVSAAAVVVSIRRDRPAADDAAGDSSGPRQQAGAWAPDSASLHRHLAVSARYRQAIACLDRQLRRSFRAIDKRLASLSSKFGEQLLMHMALLSAVYIDRAGLARQVAAASAHWAGRRAAIADGADTWGSSDTEMLATRSPFLADFALHWIAGPHAQLGPLRPVLAPLFRLLAHIFNDANELPMEMVALPSEVSRQLFGGGPGSRVGTASSGAGGGRGEKCSIFYSALQAVIRGSGRVADSILEELLRLGQLKDGASWPFQGLADAEALCAWYQQHVVERCDQWCSVISDVRAVYQCGAFTIDMKYLSFVASQVTPFSTGIATYLLNVFAVQHGRQLWRSVETTLTDMRQPVANVNDMVRRMQLLKGIYHRIAGYQADRKQLERFLHMLATAPRNSALMDRIAQLASGLVGSDGAKQSGGGVATGALLFLIKRIDEALHKLEDCTDEAVATCQVKAIPFQHRVQDDTMTLNSSALASRREMEAMFAPSTSLAHDSRCSEFARHVAETAAAASAAALSAVDAAALDPGVPSVTGPSDGKAPTAQKETQAQREEPALTTGGFRSYTDVEDALASFETRCRDLERQRKLILQFEELSGKEGTSLPICVVDIEQRLLKKLAEFQVFWRSASEWDHQVDRYLRMRPDRVHVNEVQGRAHETLRAVRGSPAPHRDLLRRRVDSLRALLQPLFMIQVLMSLSPSRTISFNAPPQQHALQVVTAATRPATSHAQAAARGKAAGAPPATDPADEHERGGANSAAAAQEAPPFDPGLNHIWDALFGQGDNGSLGGARGAATDASQVVTLRALIRTGALFRTDVLSKQYELARLEVEAVGELLSAVQWWTINVMPVEPDAPCGDPLVSAGPMLLERFQDHLGTIEQLLLDSATSAAAAAADRRVVIERTAAVGAPNSGDAALPTDAAAAAGGAAASGHVVSETYLALAREWQAKLRRMREVFVQFLNCQESWLKISPLLRSSAPPSGPALAILQEADEEFRQLVYHLADKPRLCECLEEVLAEERLWRLAQLLEQARRRLAEQCSRMQSRCPRLFLAEDELLFQLWSYSARPTQEACEAALADVVPRLFPGLGGLVLAPPSPADRGFRAAVGVRAAVLTEHEDSGDCVEPPLAFAAPVLLEGTPDRWVAAVEAAISHAFLREVRARASMASLSDWADEVMHELRKCRTNAGGDDEGSSFLPGSVLLSVAGAGASAAAVGGAPDHVLVTVERIRWSYLVTALAGEWEALVLLEEYARRRLAEQTRLASPGGALLPYILQCRDLVEKAKTEHGGATQLSFVHFGWKSNDHLAVAFERMTFDFGWELYGRDQLICPVSERHFVEVAEQLHSPKCTLFQGNLGGTVTQCFGAICGVACHQFHVMPTEVSLAALYRHLLGVGLTGHWAVLHGVDMLPEPLLNTLVKHLAAYFLQLGSSLGLFADALDRRCRLTQAIAGGRKTGRRRRRSATLTAEAQALSIVVGKLALQPDNLLAMIQGSPPGMMKMRDRECLFDEARLRLPPDFERVLCGADSQREGAGGGNGGYFRGRSSSCPAVRLAIPTVLLPAGSQRTAGGGVSASASSASCGGQHEGSSPSREGLPRARTASLPRLPTLGPREAADGQITEGSYHALVGASGACFIPRVLHPRAAVFVAPSSETRSLRSFVFQVAAFPAMDIDLFVHAGLLQVGILDEGAARMLASAVRAFNSYSYTSGPSGEGASSRRRYFSKQLGVAEVRSICKLAGWLRESREQQSKYVRVDDQILVCEAWLRAANSSLDASIERELLWQCTLVSFGRSPNFEEHETNFRQNLFGDMLMSQRVYKKDFIARFYDEISDVLKRKFSFDLVNRLLAGKSLAMTQALMTGRDIAVVGAAGAGKTDCLSTLLEAGREFLDDNGRPLFKDVQIIKVNSLAHGARQIMQLLASAGEAPRKAQLPAEEPPTTWLVFDGPADEALIASATSPTPLQVLDAAPVPTRTARRPLRVVVETDHLQGCSPALVTTLAVTYIDSHRGPTWKDRVIAWAHQMAVGCPEYAKLMVVVRELVVRLVDSIFAFVLCYFHTPSTGDERGGQAASAESAVTDLDHTHQTTCFLSFLTTLLMDPAIETHLVGTMADVPEELEREARLLIGMSSISSFGSCLFTHQRPRFERFVREQVLDPIHGEQLPPLYDLYFDSKSGSFQAVNEIVRLTEPIVAGDNLCVATEEFVAFQLRLRRLLAIDAPVLLAGRAGSGKSTLLRYLLGQRSRTLQCVLFRTSTTSAVDGLQAATLRQLTLQQHGAFWAPPPGKRMVVLIDDLHMSTHGSFAVGAGGGGRHGAIAGGASALAEWMRFTIEHRGVYNSNDSTFLSVRDATFLPSLLSPEANNLQVCKRFSRHFFVVFLETPSVESIEKIFSTVLAINLTPFVPTGVAVLTRKLHPRSSVVPSPREEIVAAVFSATLFVCSEAELAARYRLHGLARVFWDVVHAFALTPEDELKSCMDVGSLWSFAMRCSVVDSLLISEHAFVRRHIYSAIVRGCHQFFGCSLGMFGGDGEAPDPDAQAAELDHLAYMYRMEASSDGGPRLPKLRQTAVERTAAALLRRWSPSGRAPSAAAVVRPASTGSGFSEDSVSGGGGGGVSVCADGPLRPSSVAASSAASAVCEELFADDGMQALMWVHDSSMVCTLLRLCHTLHLHPVVCLVGGWAHLPLLTLASRLCGATGVELCTQMTMESLVTELMGKRTSCSGDPAEGNQLRGPEVGSLRVLAIDDEEVPPGMLADFLEAEQERYFSPGLRDTGSLAAASGSRPATGDVAPDAARPPPARRTRLVVVCRSSLSYQALTSRCAFAQQVLAATFVLPVTIALDTVATAYLPSRLLGMSSIESLPKPHRRLMMYADGGRSGTKDKSSFRQGSRNGSVWSLAPTSLDEPFKPLAHLAEAVHLRAHRCVADEFGRDFAADFCSPCRFSQFLRTFTRLARQLWFSRRQAKAVHAGALERIEELRRLRDAKDKELRGSRVSLRLLEEEASRITTRIARVDSEKRAACETLQRAQQRLKELESKIARVDARYAASLARARAQESAECRALSRLDDRLFKDLGRFLHPPPCIVTTLEVMHVILSYLSQLGEDTTAKGVPLSILAAPAPGGAALNVMAHTGNTAKPTAREEVERWAAAVGTKDILPSLQRWPTDRLLPPWLAPLLERYVADPELHPHMLHEVSPAASHFSAWLTARMECHKVLEQVETQRRSMGDLSHQVSTLNSDVAAASSELAAAESQLEELRRLHTAAVKDRESQSRVAANLQRQVQRVNAVLAAYTVRERECKAQLQMLAASEDLTEQWGGLLLTAALCCYGAAFGPPLRSAILHEVRTLLRELDVPWPQDLTAHAHLQRFLPASLLQLMQVNWHDRYLFESAAAMELSGDTCTVVLDPFDLALPWLRELHSQSFPDPAPHANARSKEHFGSSGLSLSASKARSSGRSPEQEDDLGAGEPWDFQPQGRCPAQRQEPDIIASGAPPEVVLQRVAKAMRENGVVVIQVQELSQLRGLIGALAVLSHTLESSGVLRTAEVAATFGSSQSARAAADVGAPATDGAPREESPPPESPTPTRSRPYSSPGHGPPPSAAGGGGARAAGAAALDAVSVEVQLFTLLQRLEHALPLGHRRFRLFVLLPWCPWNAAIWRPARQKKTEQIGKVPAMIWSTCSVISLDTRPVHPAHMFVSVFAEAADPIEFRKAHLSRMALSANCTRLKVAEELLLDVMIKANSKDLLDEVFCRTARRYCEFADRLTKVVGEGLHEEKLRTMMSRQQHSKFAGSVAVLLCAMIDVEVANTEGGGGPCAAEHLNVHVDDYSVRPCVLVMLLMHHLRNAPSPREAVASFFQMALLAAGQRRAALVRVFLLLESHLARHRRVEALWEGLVPGASSKRRTQGGPNSPAPDGRESPAGESGAADAGDDGHGTPAASGDDGGEGDISPDAEAPEDDADEEQSEEEDEEINENSEDEDEDADAASDAKMAGGEDENGDKPQEKEASMASEEVELDDESRASLALANDQLCLHAQASQGRVAKICDLADRLFPALRFPQDMYEQLTLLPAFLPLIIPHRGLPAVLRAAKKEGAQIVNESAISIRQQGFAAHIANAVAFGGTWLLVDIADVTDFNEVADALHLFLHDGLRRLPYWRAATAVRRSLLLLGDPAQHSAAIAEAAVGSKPSRLVLYCSADSTRVPRHVVRLCLCVQSASRFFGARAERTSEAAPPPVAASAEASNRATPDGSPCNVAFASLAAGPENDVGGRGGPGSTSSSSAPSSPSTSIPSGARMSDGAHLEVASRLHLMSANSRELPPLLQELIGFLAETHPLLFARPPPGHENSGATAIARIQTAFHSHASRFRQVVNCHPKSVPEWVEDHIVLRARDFVYRNSLSAVLQSFSPALIRRSDKDVKAALGILAGKMSTMMQLVSATVNMLGPTSPFWLRLELHRAAALLRAVRADVLGCQGALQGDVHWNARLFEVYTACAHGLAPWDGHRPLATWLGSLQEHLAFMVEWQPGAPTDSAPFRLASVSNLHSFLSSYSKDTGSFHWRLERCPPEKLTMNGKQVPGTARSTSEVQHRPPPPPQPGTLTWEMIQALTKRAVMREFVQTHRAGGKHVPSAAPADVDLGDASPTQERRPPGEARLGGEVRFRDVAAAMAAAAEGTEADSVKAFEAGLLVERLRLIGSGWDPGRGDGQLAGDHRPDSYEVELPPMVIRPIRGPPPRSEEWYSCPLVIARLDAYGADLATSAAAQVLVRTAQSPAVCTLRGVRLASYA